MKVFNFIDGHLDVFLGLALSLWLGYASFATAQWVLGVGAFSASALYMGKLYLREYGTLKQQQY